MHTRARSVENPTPSVDRLTRPRSVTPYAVVGAGLFQTKQQFPHNDTFTSSEGAFTAGGGVRALVGKYVTVGAEAPVGWALHLRVNGTIGIQLGK